MWLCSGSGFWFPGLRKNRFLLCQPLCLWYFGTVVLGGSIPALENLILSMPRPVQYTSTYRVIQNSQCRGCRGNDRPRWDQFKLAWVTSMFQDILCCVTCLHATFIANQIHSSLSHIASPNLQILQNLHKCLPHKNPRPSLVILIYQSYFRKKINLHSVSKWGFLEVWKASVRQCLHNWSCLQSHRLTVSLWGWQSHL